MSKPITQVTAKIQKGLFETVETKVFNGTGENDIYRQIEKHLEDNYPAIAEWARYEKNYADNNVTIIL